MRRIKLLQFCILSFFIISLFQFIFYFQYVKGSYAVTVTSKYSEEPPLIDGTMNIAEWKEANHFENIGDYNKFNLFLIHGENHFYVGLEIMDNTVDSKDFVVVFFDEGNDGKYGSGSGDGVLNDQQEDRNSIIADGRRWDGYWSSDKNDFCVPGADISIDFEAAMKYHNDHWEVEFKIPFKGEDGNSQDLSDLNINMSDNVGLIILFSDASTQEYFFCPEAASTHNPSSWFNLTFEQPLIFGIDQTLFYILITAIIGLIIIYLYETGRLKL